LLVPRRIGDDELALVAREEAIGDVDGDSLLAFGRESVDQQREIDGVALRSMPPAVVLERRKLVVENLPGFIQQSADQRRLPVIDAAAGDEPEQLLLLLFGEPALDVGRAVQK
jgi:hypothetical protein